MAELKYPTAAWYGQVRDAVDVDDELFQRRSHAAIDLARLYFVRDTVRLEQPEIATQGPALLLTDVAELWLPRIRAGSLVIKRSEITRGSG